MYEYKLEFMPSVKEVLYHGVGRIEVVNAFLRNNSYYFHDIYKQLSKKAQSVQIYLNKTSIVWL